MGPYRERWHISLMVHWMVTEFSTSDNPQIYNQIFFGIFLLSHSHFSLFLHIFLILCSSLSCFVCLFPLIMASCLHPFLFWIPCCNYPFFLTDLLSLTLFFFPCPLCKIMTSKCKMSNLEIRVFMWNGCPFQWLPKMFASNCVLF